MSDCQSCRVEEICHYPYKPCDCVHLRKFWDAERRAKHDEAEIVIQKQVQHERVVIPEKASDLLFQSAEPFDKACMMVKEMEGKIETLLTEKAALAGALEELCFLKAIKDRCGKTPEYLERQPKAWDAAFQVVSTLEV